MNVKLIQATRFDKFSRNGLITFVVRIPRWVHMELLTHKRFARNASSSRAQSTKRFTDMDYYTPDTFYFDKNGMEKGEPIGYPMNETIKEVWEETWKFCKAQAENLAAYGLTKQQANRVLPPISYIETIITGTEFAWVCFLALRDSPKADPAMEEFAKMIDAEIKKIEWDIKSYHVPFFNNMFDRDAAAGAIARVSYTLDEVDKVRLIDLANRLKVDGHMSPFEHIAWRKRLPPASAVCTCEEDLFLEFGWVNYRTVLEGKSADVIKVDQSIINIEDGIVIQK